MVALTKEEGSTSGKRLGECKVFRQPSVTPQESRRGVRPWGIPRPLRTFVLEIFENPTVGVPRP